jgi:hypothetical protein
MFYGISVGYVLFFGRPRWTVQRVTVCGLITALNVDSCSENERSPFTEPVAFLIGRRCRSLGGPPEKACSLPDLHPCFRVFARRSNPRSYASQRDSRSRSLSRRFTSSSCLTRRLFLPFRVCNQKPKS